MPITRRPAALAVAATLIAPALARADDWGGVTRAQAAGIKIDPAARKIMANAPIGSCLNDPTQAKCDRPTAIVADGHLMPDGRTGYSEPGATTASLPRPVHRRPNARAAAVPQCFVRANSLVKSTGRAAARRTADRQPAALGGGGGRSERPGRASARRRHATRATRGEPGAGVMVGPWASGRVARRDTSRTLSFTLPLDLTTAEAARLADFIKTLPFEETARATSATSAD